MCGCGLTECVMMEKDNKIFIPYLCTKHKKNEGTHTLAPFLSLFSIKNMFHAI